MFKFIDDLVVFNSNDFKVLASKLYPQVLVLKRADTMDKISFHDLKIKREGRLLDWPVR